MKPQLTAIIWWPHSGGRWFCRSILKQHSAVHQTVFTHPWLYNSTDMMMEDDNTAQVHKARSLPELNEHLEALVQSMNHGKREALTKYFDMVKDYSIEEHKSHIIGEICMGSPIPKYIDIELLLQADPTMKVIHLVRHPSESFSSFTKRYEMDNDPVKIASSWVGLNYRIRNYFEEHSQFASQYLAVRYEDLLSDTDNEVKKVCDFMNISFEEAMTSSLEQRWGRNTKNKISDLDKNIIETIAHVELNNYNY